MNAVVKQGDIIKEAVNRTFNEPEWFLREVLHEEPESWQVQGIEAVMDAHRFIRGLPTKYNHDGLQRVSIRSCHGPGKTHFLGYLMHVWNFIFYSKVVCTAPKEKQLKTRLWPRYRKILKNADAGYRNRITVNAIDIKIMNDEDWGCVAETASDPENMAGYHDDKQLVLVDEGSARVLDPMYPVIEGALSTPGSVLVVIGNPTRATGEFYSSHNKRGTMELYYRMHIKPEMSRFVDPKWVKAMIAKYGESSPITKVRVLGEFADVEDNQLIAMGWLEDARMQDFAPDGSLPSKRMSIDVADGGEDETVITVAHIYETRTLMYRMHRFSFPQNTATDDIVNAAVRIAEANDFDKVEDDIVVDSIGVGTGVASNLITAGWRVVRFKGGSTEGVDTTEYRNLRVRSYLVYRDALLEGSVYYDDEFCSEEDWDDYISQMVTIRTKPGQETKEDLESKKDMKGQGVKSPDMPDGTSMIYATESPDYESGQYFKPALTGTTESYHNDSGIY